MHVPDIGVVVDAKKPMGEVDIHIEFNDDYHIMGSSLTQKELYGIPSNVKAGEKITISLESRRSGVMVLSQTSKLAQGYRYKLFAIIFHNDGEEVKVEEEPGDDEVFSRWMKLQYLEHTIYFRSKSKKWYVCVPSNEKISTRLPITDYLEVEPTTLFRYVFKQVSEEALRSSGNRVRAKRARRDRILRLEYENPNLKERVARLCTILSRIRGVRWYRKLPEDIRNSIADELDVSNDEVSAIYKDYSSVQNTPCVDGQPHGEQ